MKRLRAAIGVNEVLAVIGLGLMTTGIAMLSVPVSLIVPGGLIFILAVWPILHASRGK